MPNTDLLDSIYGDLLNQNKDWEDKARALRGGLRMLRASMDLTLNELYGADWLAEYQAVRESIDDLLREVAGD